jgi:hypothetical protein
MYIELERRLRRSYTVRCESADREERERANLWKDDRIADAWLVSNLVKTRPLVGPPTPP